MSECKDENMLTQVSSKEEMKIKNNNHWTRKKTVKIFWNNNTISEICEKWIFCSNNYAYIRCEKLHTVALY